MSAYNVTTARVLDEVERERCRQDEKWGEQNHPDGTARAGDPMTATLARIATTAAADEGRVTWRHILSEEVAEAYAESDPETLRAELVQVAAVAVAWIEAIDRSGATQ